MQFVVVNPFLNACARSLDIFLELLFYAAINTRQVTVSHTKI